MRSSSTTPAATARASLGRPYHPDRGRQTDLRLGRREREWQDDPGPSRRRSDASQRRPGGSGRRRLPPEVGSRPHAVLRRLQMVFQSPEASLNPRRTVGEALERPLRMLAGLDRKAAPGAGPRPARGGATADVALPPLPGRAERRRKAAGGYRAGLRCRARPRDLRRTPVVARRLRTGGADEPAARPTG